MDAVAGPPAAFTPVRAAVIGTGKISEEHLRFLAENDGIVLAGVCDVSPAMARYAAERFGAEKSYTDVAQMLREANADVVHVLTPAGSHAGLIRQSLLAGTHVIVEKPVAMSNGEFRELFDLAERQGRRLIEDHNYRFNKPFRRIERLLRDGILGEVREVEVRLALDVRGPTSRYADPNLLHPSHALPAGVIHEFITHLCYLALRFLPNSPRMRVRADWANLGGSAFGFRYDDLDATVSAGGIRARICFTAQTAPESFVITVRGTRGCAHADLFHPHLQLWRSDAPFGPAGPIIEQIRNGGRLVQAGIRGFRDKLLQQTPYEGLAKFLAQTYAAFRTGRTPPVTFADMDRTSRLIDAMLAQAGADAPRECAA